ESRISSHPDGAAGEIGVGQGAVGGGPETFLEGAGARDARDVAGDLDFGAAGGGTGHEVLHFGAAAAFVHAEGNVIHAGSQSQVGMTQVTGDHGGVVVIAAGGALIDVVVDDQLIVSGIGAVGELAVVVQVDPHRGAVVAGATELVDTGIGSA